MGYLPVTVDYLLTYYRHHHATYLEYLIALQDIITSYRYLSPCGISAGRHGNHATLEAYIRGQSRGLYSVHILGTS